MMTRFPLAFAALCAFATPVLAEVIPLVPTEPLDGPYIGAMDVSAQMAEPMTYDRIVTMSDMDGDPTQISEAEAEMIVLLSQVLTVAPVQN